MKGKGKVIIAYAITAYGAGGMTPQLLNITLRGNELLKLTAVSP